MSHATFVRSRSQRDLEEWSLIAKDKASRIEGARRLFHNATTPGERASAEEALKRMGADPGDKAHYTASQRRTGGYQPPPRSGYQPPPRSSYQPPPRSGGYTPPGGGGHSSWEETLRRAQEQERRAREAYQQRMRAEHAYRKKFDQDLISDARKAGARSGRLDAKWLREDKPLRSFRAASPRARLLSGAAMVGAAGAWGGLRYRQYSKQKVRKALKGWTEEEKRGRRRNVAAAAGGSALSAGSLYALGSGVNRARHARNLDEWSYQTKKTPWRSTLSYTSGYHPDTSRLAEEAHQAAHRGAMKGVRAEGVQAGKTARFLRRSAGRRAILGSAGLMTGLVANEVARERMKNRDRRVQARLRRAGANR